MMTGPPLMARDSWRSHHHERKNKAWVAALPKPDKDGPRKRSNSAPALERGHHPHIHYIFSKPLNSLKSQPLETSKRENFQAALFDCQERYPLEQDVDGCQPKMWDTSSTERKRKKHQHSSDLTSPIESEDVSSLQSLENTIALPSNIENEGVATSCKRIKLSTPQIKKYHDHNVFESLSHSRRAAVRLVDELGDHSDALALNSDLTTADMDGEAREQNTISGNGTATKDKKSSWGFLARYHGPANNFPDYGESATSSPVVLVSRRDTMGAGEKKSGMPGSFRPLNTLQRKGNSSSVLPRQTQKKVFDLHSNNSNKASDKPRAVKRQKVGSENVVRRESSGSVINISGDGSLVGTVRNTPSTSSTQKKTVQSVGSHQSQPHLTRLGEVDEYNKTEAMVGFLLKKKRKASLLESEQRSSFRGEIDSSSRQHNNSLKSDTQTFVSNRGNPKSVDGAGKQPIVIDDIETKEVVEVSNAPKAYQDTTRNATPRPEANKVSSTAEELQWFHNAGKRGIADNGGPHTAASSGSPQSTDEGPESVNRGSSSSSQSPGNAVDDVQYLEDDSVDLVELDDGLATVDQKAESRARFNKTALKPYGTRKSESIADGGDIPWSKFSGLRSETLQIPTSRIIKSDISFEITYMQSGRKELHLSKGYLPWKLQYDHDRQEFDIIAYDDSVREEYLSLVLKPEKIHVVKYCYNSLKVVISRAIEASIGSAGQVLILMSRLGDGYRLAQSLLKLNHTIKLSLLQSEQLDKIFDTSKKSTAAAKQQPQDIALLTVKEARVASGRGKAWQSTLKSVNVSTEEFGQSANIGRRRNSTAGQNTSTQTRRQSIANRMLPNSLTDASVSARTLRVIIPARSEPFISSRLSTLKGEDFYGSRPTTRAFSGQRNGEQQFQPPKSRSPSPLRWTAENPSWKEDRLWDASLTFQTEGKKKATVDARDIERLDEGEFLNDNLIEFYLRYLEDRLEKSQPELARRIYFHNTFFYESLTKGKVRSNNINYDAVKRWTSKVDLFSYDYIVVPVCEKLHWYVAIICNAPRLLQTDLPDVLMSHHTDEQATLAVKAVSVRTLDDGYDDSETSKLLGSGTKAVEPASASPSVTAQVEHMSLDDQEWPEPDAIPDGITPGIARLRSLQRAANPHNDPSGEDSFENQGQAENVHLKGKKLKRKSIPRARKYDPADPRIITLDSLGQSHSPTCSNLREYLVCEAEARHNLDIKPGHLGMTAKGLPQQSNYCDCGVFVLGYVEKFLKNPDEFVFSILQGDMTASGDWAAIQAPNMRGGIRDLIFKLHAEQTHKGKEQRGAKSKAKKASNAAAQPRVSGKLLDSTSQLASRKISKVINSSGESNDSDLTAPAMQLASRSVTGKFMDGLRPETSVIVRPLFIAADDQETAPVQEKELFSNDRLRATRSRHFPGTSNASLNKTEESQIVKTPAPSIEDGPILVTQGSICRDGDELSSPEHSGESSIKLDSPLHSTFMQDNWLKSPPRRAAGRSDTHNTFKDFAKDGGSPFQNTRHKGRRNGTSEQNPLEIKDSQEGRQLEVRETPPRQNQKDESFEDVMDSSNQPRASKVYILGGGHSPDLEPLSPRRALRRKLGTHS